MKIWFIFAIIALASHSIYARDMQEIREEGLVGKIFYPPTSEKKPAILVLSGSDGGFYESRAKSFAQEGYVALALAYFHAEGLPQNLENIPLEYFHKGIQWLKKQPEVQSDKIHLYGPSRGGELVLLLASTFPEEIASVVAVVPSCAAYGGIPDETLPAWTWGGLAIPFAPGPGKKDVYKQLENRETVDLAALFLEKMQDKAAFERALIPVENIRCPILLISGKEDRM